MMYSELNRIGVTFISKNEQFDTSTAIGEAMLKIILVFAELERNMTSERVASVMVSRASEGIWNGGNVPYGYTYSKELKQFSIEPDESRIVDLIYYHYEQSRSLVTTSRELNSQGYRTRRGNFWNPVSCHIILRNPFYIGIYRYNYYKDPYKKIKRDESEWVVVQNHHPAIITTERFNRVNQILDDNSAKRNMKGMTLNRGNVHVFQGLLICGHCGSVMTCTTKRFADGFRSSSYLCPTKRRDGNVECRHTSDVVVGNFVLNFVVNMLDAKKKASEIANKDALSAHLLRGPAFDAVCCIDDSSLEELMQSIIHSGSKRFSLKPRQLPVRSELSKVKSDMEKCKRAIERLKSLFLYDDNSMSQQEFIEEKLALEERIGFLNEQYRLLSAVSRDAGYLSDDELIKKASAFAFQRKVSGGKYLNYRKLMSSIDKKVAYDFMHSIIDHVTMKYGHVDSITFLNGITVRFTYGDISGTS